MCLIGASLISLPRAWGRIGSERQQLSNSALLTNYEHDDPDEQKRISPPVGNDGDTFAYSLRPNADWERALNGKIFETGQWPGHPQSGDVQYRYCENTSGSWIEKRLDRYGPSEGKELPSVLRSSLGEAKIANALIDWISTDMSACGKWWPV